MKNRIKVLRAEHDWSQAQLAQELGVSRQTVNAIETGKYDPGLPLAFDLARVFSRRIEDIFFPAEPAPKPTPLPIPEPAPQPRLFEDLDVSLI